MKRLLLSIIILISFSSAFASHIVGGEVFYKYLGVGADPNTSKYEVTLRLFTECGQVCGGTTGVACPPTDAIISIFANSAPYTRVTNIAVFNTGQPQLNLSDYPVCIDNKPTVCYQVNVYSATVELPNNVVGYRLAYQSCCRANTINVFPDAPSANGEPGAAYEATIPGTNVLPVGSNSTAIVNLKDTALICYKSRFTLEFNATDPDGDSLSYQFVSAYNGGSHTASENTQADNPLYGVVTYEAGYSGTSPLGPTVTIDPRTGIISGTSPDEVGKYVINVIVREWRGGVLIAEHRKDFLIRVNQCSFPKAELDITKSTCDGLTVNFQNNNNDPLNVTFDWLFDDLTSGASNTSSEEFPTHTFSGPGDYNVRLIVNAGTPCADTAYSLQRVWPGFHPAVGPVPPACKDFPVQFHDVSTTDFPPLNYWRWDFGVQTLTNDTSHLQNPTYTYHTAGTYTVEFIVQSEKGCRDTLYSEVNIVDKPEFFISKDTLICVVDTLQLHSNVTTGTITWSPNYMISDIHSFNPLVSPDVPKTYTAVYQDPTGCTATASVTVNVVSDVTLLAINDTTICRTDTATLHLNTDALYFSWTPVDKIVDPTVKDPRVFPTDPVTPFNVRASISNKCFKDKTINVTTVPYPIPLVSGDADICFGKDAQLHASGGSNYLWSPPAYLNSTVIPDPKSIKPKVSLTYTVRVTDTLGCPKPVFKDFKVNVIKLVADAGPSDTSIVLGQPLLLHGTGGTIYEWTPSDYLDDIHSPTPVSLPQNNITYTLKVSNSTGCTDFDTINVKVYFLPPDIYVPSAFTPGGDGKNDVFRPITLGIRSLESFSIYTRWGMLIYKTSRIGEGWDGKYKGTPQDPGTFVWQANATDYKGQKIFRKGTVILIR